MQLLSKIKLLRSTTLIHKKKRKIIENNIKTGKEKEKTNQTSKATRKTNYSEGKKKKQRNKRLMWRNNNNPNHIVANGGPLVSHKMKAPRVFSGT